MAGTQANAAAAAAAAAANAALSTLSLSSSGTIVVADAKAMIAAKYPKLYSRFNYAFHGHDDCTPLAEVVDVIKSDVHAWLQSMPENFKTSNHALSRPKYGLVFVLQNEQVRNSLGEALCTSAIDLVEAAWEECKRDLVVAKDDTPVLETEDELRARNEDLVTKNDILASAIIALVAKNYDSTITNLVETLIKRC